MDVVQVRLSDELQEAVDRQIAEGRVADAEAFFVEAARRYVEDLEFEDELVAEARAGSADIEAGRFRTIATPEDAEAWHQKRMQRLRERLTADAD